MVYVFLLHKDQLEMAVEEVRALSKCSNFTLHGHFLIVEDALSDDVVSRLSVRLALTRQISRVLFSCDVDELRDVCESFDFMSVYKGSFCCRREVSGDEDALIFSEKELGDLAGDQIKDYEVDLENPKTTFVFYFCSGMVHCGVLVSEQHESFDSRRAHLRPFHHPSSLHPRFARAFVNLTGVSHDGCVVDPFCGSGGLLIEAGLMGISCVGYDVSEKMLAGCRKNLDYFKVDGMQLVNRDALDLLTSEHVVCDLPYGRNCNLFVDDEDGVEKISLRKDDREGQLHELVVFYEAFLRVLEKKLVKRAVVVFPNFVSHRDLIEKTALYIKAEFSVYVHKRLSRSVVVIEK